MVWSSNFHFKPFPGQRRRERARERKERKPKSRLWRHRRTPSSSPTIARTRLHWSHQSQHHATQSRLRSRLRAILPSTQSLRPTDLQPTDLFLWFWFLLLLWWCGSGVLVVVAFDCRSLLPRVELEFRWCVGLGFDCDLFHGLGFGCDFESFCNKICLDVEKIVEKMWKICRKIAFSE